MHPIFKVLTALLVIALIADAAFIGYLQFTGRGFTAVREAVTEESAAEEQPLPELNDEQSAAFEGILSLYDGQHASGSLLYGVTGSGKTAVYVRLIDAMRRKGKASI